MSESKVKNMTIDELLERFAAIGVAQDKALLDDDFARYNKLYGQMNEVDSELRARGTESRLALLRLFDHPNIQVRLRAAARAMAVAPAQARKLLEEIAASRHFPQAGDAGMLVSGLDDGTFRPT